MKLTYFQLEPQLAKSILPVFIVSGEEPFLKQDACNLIRKAAKKNGFNERSRLTVDASLSQEQLYSTLFSGSLLSEKRLIELDASSATPNKQIAAILEEYALHTSADILLLLNLGKLDDKITKSSWYRALDKIGATITIWPIAREHLPKWIIERGKKYKLTIQSDAANLLADFVEGNLIAAAQAIEKIYLLQPTQPINADLIQTILSDESRFTVFDLIENLIAGNTTRMLHVLDSLKSEGTEAVLVLWALCRELRLLAELGLSHQQGQSYDQLFQKHRVFARRQGAIRHFLAKKSYIQCLALLADASAVDEVIKGAMPGDSWDTLRIFCLKVL